MSLLKNVDKVIEIKIKVGNADKIKKEDIVNNKGKKNENIIKKKIRKKQKKKNLKNLNSKSSTRDFIKSNDDENTNSKKVDAIQIINKPTENIESKEEKLRNIHYLDLELNSASYEESLKFDKRTFFQYYLSLAREKHILFSAFFPMSNYNSRIIKVNLIFYSFTLYYFVNALFFTDETMHKIYEDEGIFNFLYSIPQILYSTVISGIINFFVNYLSLSQKLIIQLKRENNINEVIKKSRKIKKCLLIKFICFYFSCFMLLIIFFWYYLACFGAIYKNTQIYLLKDTLISFGLSLLYPFIFYIIPAFLRITSLNYPQRFYKLSLFTQALL